MTEKERMEAGLIYDPGVEEIIMEQSSYLETLYDFNATRPNEMDKRNELMQEMFAEIGDNSVIGGGSVVTKDIPANVVAVGNPCKVMREISEADKEFYYRDEKIDWENLK